MVEKVDEEAHVSVVGEYVVVTTSSGKVYSFYKPSFIGYKEYRAYLTVTIVLFILGILLYIEIQSLSSLLNPSTRASALYIVAGFIVAGIIAALIKKKNLTIESTAGTSIIFKKINVTDKQLIDIVKKLSTATAKEQQYNKQHSNTQQ